MWVWTDANNLNQTELLPGTECALESHKVEPNTNLA